MDVRLKIMAATDCVLAAALCALVLGSGLLFGGAVWWFPPALAGLALLMVLTRLVQFAALGRLTILKSPLTFLGLMFWHASQWQRRRG